MLHPKYVLETTKQIHKINNHSPKNSTLLSSWKCSQKQFALTVDSHLDSWTCVCNNALLNIAHKSLMDLFFAYVDRLVKVKMDSFL